MSNSSVLLKSCRVPLSKTKSRARCPPNSMGWGPYLQSIKSIKACTHRPTLHTACQHLVDMQKLCSTMQDCMHHHCNIGQRWPQCAAVQGSSPQQQGAISANQQTLC